MASGAEPSRHSGEARSSPRDGTDIIAKVRFQKTDQQVNIVDLNAHGCGFETRWSIPSGLSATLHICGLEPWRGTIIWSENGRSGMAFDRPFHSAVAARLTGRDWRP